MKVLITTHVFLPDYSAGTEVLALNTARELQRLGHEVEIFTGYLPKPDKPAPSTPEGFDRYEYDGFKVNRFFHHANPLGGQTSMVEAEYNNLIFASWFRSYLMHYQPDIVHFFHLWLLSAAAIDICNELEIPMVMTPTDFWLICPNNQLRLPDNSLCKGPDSNGVNCMKHAVANNQSTRVAAVFNRLPHKVVSTMIWGINHGAFSGAWFSPMVRALYQRAGFLRTRMNMLDRVIVPTRLMEEMLVLNGLQPDKVVFSRFGIRAVAPETHKPDSVGKLRIGFIGGLSEHKGVHLLIQAVRLLPKTVLLELKIFGKTDLFPEYFNKLMRLADGDQRIGFCGTFPNEQIGSVFSELDVLVVPSIWYENTPLVIYSAQAVGCPVIASNLGGMAEVVEHEKNGLLFKAGDVVGLAASIGRLTDDQELLHKLASNAVKPKSISEYVSELLNIYNDVLVRKRGAK